MRFYVCGSVHHASIVLIIRQDPTSIALCVLWHCLLVPLMLTLIYVGISCFCLHTLLYHMAAFVLYSFLLVFLYL